MALSNRQTIAANLRTAPVPRSFVHEPAANKPPAPDSAFNFTADPATDLLTTAAHGLAADVRIRLTNTGGALPAGLSAATDYYVLASGLTANAFKVSTTPGGGPVDITSAGTGTHSWQRYLTADEQAKVNEFLAYVTDSSGPLPAAADSAQAASLIAAYAVYHHSPAYLTWWHDNEMSRDAQRQLRRADMFSANDATVPPSGDSGGVGSDPPTSPVPRDPL